MNKELIQLFERNDGILTSKILKLHHIYFYNIRQLLDNQTIIRIKPGVYKLNSVANDRHELVEISKIIPNGVICLLTAATYYELTTFVSSEYQLAIQRHSKITLPDYPPIQLLYWSDAPFELGQTKIKIANTEVSIYNKEKTVCDIIKYRNKIGMDTMKEVLKNYLDRPERNIVLLSLYAKKMRLSSIMSQYLEILL